MGTTQATRISKLNIVAKKYEETLRFYRTLGVSFPQVLAQPPGTRHAEAADHVGTSFSLDNPSLAQIYNAEWRQSAGHNSILITAELPSREAVDSIYAILVAAGYAGLQVPYDAFWGARYAAVRDPEGNSVGLESPLDNTTTYWPPKQSPDS
jgi:uncharacterized glyoxalase superfamily protein PhnB